MQYEDFREYAIAYRWPTLPEGRWRVREVFKDRENAEKGIQQLIENQKQLQAWDIERKGEIQPKHQETYKVVTRVRTAWYDDNEDFVNYDAVPQYRDKDKTILAHICR